MSSLLFLSGSSRQGSVNTRLTLAAMTEAKQQGATDVRHLDLKTLQLPLFDEDCEDSEGTPIGAEQFAEAIKAAQGIFIACPEYNGSLTPLLKNAVDWATRVDGNPFNEKIMAISAASPGGLGGLRGLVSARLLFSNLNATVIGQQLAVGKAHEAFSPDGILTNEYYKKALSNIVRQLITLSAA